MINAWGKFIGNLKIIFKPTLEIFIINEDYFTFYSENVSAAPQSSNDGFPNQK